MQWIDTKQVLMKTSSPEEWFGFDYTINLYKGCMHGCIYCDSRSQCYRIDHFDIVRGKKDSHLILSNELKGKKKKGIIGMGSMSDPYNGFEKEEKLTREALKRIAYYGFGVGINTKSDLVLRDLDILIQIHKKYTSVINVTITTADDDCAKKIEPYAPSSTKRFEVVRKCKEAGLISGILMTPVLPFITDSKENIQSIIEKAAISHADYIVTYMGVTLRQNQRDYYYEKLDELFPGLSYQYQRVFQNRYHCETPLWRENWEFFKQECQKHGILYEMDDIVKLIASHKQEIKQLSFFD